MESSWASAPSMQNLVRRKRWLASGPKKSESKKNQENFYEEGLRVESADFGSFHSYGCGSCSVALRANLLLGSRTVFYEEVCWSRPSAASFDRGQQRGKFQQRRHGLDEFGRQLAGAHPGQRRLCDARFLGCQRESGYLTGCRHLYGTGRHQAVSERRPDDDGAGDFDYCGDRDAIL